MQLRAYLAMLRRFWPLILLLPLAAGGLSLGLSLRQPVRYQASVRLMIARGLIDTGGVASMPDFNDSYSWTTTEFILDDLPQVIGSAAFATDVQAAVAAAGLSVTPAAIQAGLRGEVLHRELYLTVVADTPDLALAIAHGAVAALQSQGLSYWGRSPGGLDVATLDPPQPAGTVGGLSDKLLSAALRAALGLAVAVGLALLINYLDDRLRSPAQAEQWTGARVLASIPKE
ncbi:MAG: lipopolysaccharide biosynthesis protein [Chloroflexales bacterium]